MGIPPSPTQGGLVVLDGPLFASPSCESLKSDISQNFDGIIGEIEKWAEILN